MEEHIGEHTAESVGSTVSIKPLIPGFEELQPGAMRNILEYAVTSGYTEVDPDNLSDLSKLPLTVIRTLLKKDYFGTGGDLSMCIPDHGVAIRTALQTRRTLLIESARHAGSNVTDPDDVPNMLENIRQSQRGPDKSPEDGYPF